jgi:hypothetical protein
MVAEGLVIFACLSSNGCSRTSSLYFTEHPEVKKYFDREGTYVEHYLGPYIIDTVGPALFVVGGGTGTIKLNKYFSVQINKQSGILTFRWDL